MIRTGLARIAGCIAISGCVAAFADSGSAAHVAKTPAPDRPEVASPAAGAVAHKHLSIGVTVSPDTGTLSADAVLQLPPAQAGEELRYVLGERFVIQHVDAGPNARLSIAPTDVPWSGIQRITIRFEQSDPAPNLHLRYHGTPNPAGDLPLNMITPELVELSLDGMWVPIRDDLTGRFTVSARIAGLPETVSLAAQGEIVRDGEVLRVRRDFPEIDFALIAAPGLTGVGDGRFEFYGQDPNSAQAVLFRSQARAVLAFLEPWLGPMPGGPARIVLVSRLRPSGYARRGYVVFVEGSEPSERGTGHFVAHEFGHAWFSGGTDEHRWLSESFAEYVAMRYSEAAFGPERLETLVNSKRKAAEGALPVIHPDRTDTELYAKGPLLLMELERMMGRERFDPFLARIGREKVETTGDFLRMLEREAGASLALKFEALLER